MPTYVDPVCNEEVDPDEAAGKSVFNGKTYYFCTSEDKRLFDKDPEKYIKPVKAKAKAR